MIQMSPFYLLSPLQFFELIFLLAQICRHTTEAFYYLKDKPEDNMFKTVVGFGCMISVAWFVTSVLKFNSTDHAIMDVHAITQT